MSKCVWFVILVLAFSIIIIGCKSNANAPLTAIPSDDEQISELISNEYSDYFSFADLEEGNAYSGSNTFSIDQLDTSITPSRWGRVIQSDSISHTFRLDSLNYNVAYVTMTRTVHGVMRVIYGSPAQTIEKPFVDTYNKKAVFWRIDSTSIPALSWRLVKVTEIEGRTDGSTLPNIAYATLYRKPRNGGIWGSWTQIGLPIMYPLDYWLTTDSIPTFIGGDSIRVDVTMANAGHWCGLFHFQPHGAFSNDTRLPFDSLGSNQFRILGKIPVFQTSIFRRAYIDFMTWGSLYNDNVNSYSANVFGVLYKVQ